MSLPVVPLILSIENNSAIIYNSTELIGTISCNNLTPRTVYTTVGAVLAVGTPLYTDAGLTSLLISSTFNYGVQLTTDINGEIESTIVTCAGYVTVYSDCNDNNPEVVYPSNNTNPFPNGTGIFVNSDMTTEHSSFSFVYLDEQYDYTSISSATTHVGKCRDEYVGVISCSDGTLRTIYVAKDTPLQVGTTLCTDVFLASTLSSSTFLYAGIRYTTGVAGDVTSVSICLGAYTIYSNCSLDNPLIVYASTSPNSVGVHLYLDADGYTEKGDAASFVFTGGIYTYSTIAGANFAEACST